MNEINNDTGLEIAVIGMAGKFPGARNVDEFWENLKNSVETIAFFADSELPDDESALHKSPGFVKVNGGTLEDVEFFDSLFFGYALEEAELLNPQVRMFLECSWEALEQAGVNPGNPDNTIGLYAGALHNFDWELRTLFSVKTRNIGEFAASKFAANRYLCSRVSYNLNLNGPSITLQTACSTSLVAIHLAGQAILAGECNVALAGAVSISTQQRMGHLYQEGSIFSADGHCRVFAKEASGTVFSDGLGVVVLKSLTDAIAEGHHILAVIKGSAVNNDGGERIGFTAPCVDGQVKVIRNAIYAADIDPESIGYVECHGTGTILGDPIEIEALTRAFNSDKQKYCAVGSVKSNIGHLDTAAGVAGFIKTVLILMHKLIPPTVHFQTPNPKIDFDNSPFYVNTKLSPWPDDNLPRRAGVSSFGIGGTNAHIVLEEAPPGVRNCAPSYRDYRLLMFSARTMSALEKISENVNRFLEDNKEIPLEDAAYTLQVGRKTFEYKKYVLGSTREGLLESLKSPNEQGTGVFFSKDRNVPVVFMFPGQGAQYVNMGLGLYRSEPVFRREMDRCFEILSPLTGCDMKEILYPSSPLPGPQGTQTSSSSDADRQEKIKQTEIAQPLVFAVEYALSMLVMEWGIKPDVMIGHSIGEYTAACLSGVFSLDDALKLTAIRGRLMQGMPPGAMLSVSIPEEQLKPFMNRDISLAAVNSTAHCVISGGHKAVEKFETQMKALGHPCRRLHTSHAFHSFMMEPILAEFAAKVREVPREKLGIPFISGVSGRRISTETAIDAGYWAKHLREPVNFRDGIGRLLEKKGVLFIEVGPGNALSTFLRQHRDRKDDHLAVNLVRHPHEDATDEYFLLNKIGQLWLYGVKIDWSGFYAHENRSLIALPTYPFERQKFSIHGFSVLNKAQLAEYVSAPLSAQQGKPTAVELQEPASAGEREKPLLYTRPNLTKPYIEPRNELEWELAKIWRNFFGFQSMGIDDDFFELGGDSLRATAIIAAIHRKLKVKVPLAEMFKLPTIRRLSKFIGEAATTPYTKIKAVEKKEYYMLSSAQKRVYILHQFETGETAYNMTTILTLEEKIPGDKLEEIFRKSIARHDSLRTSFIVINEEPVQKISEEVEFAIEIYRSGMAGMEPEGGNHKEGNRPESIIKEFVRPFDLSCAPLLRVGLIKSENEKLMLMIDIHHIIADGISQDILIRDFLLLHSGLELPKLQIQYKDYSQWRQSEDVRQTLTKQEDYWLKEFQEQAPVLHIPTDYPRPPRQNFEGNVIDFELKTEETGKLKEIAAAESSTLFMVILAMFNVLLAKLANQEEIVVGTPIAGRRHTDLEKIVGMFVNTFALRNFPAGVKPFNAFLNEIKEKTIKAFENQDYPFEDLVEKVVSQRDLSRNPLFDVMFVFQNFFDLSGGSGELQGKKGEEIKVKPYIFERKTSRFDLTLFGTEREGRLLFTCEFSTKLFKPKSIEGFITYFLKIAAALIENPGRKIAEIEIISGEEKSRLLFDFNNTRAEYPTDKTIQDLFAEQAEQTPDRIAVVGPSLNSTAFYDTQAHLSYRQLAVTSTGLAIRLKGNGVEADAIVAIRMERSVGMIIGILGILKAGGAYLPIATDYSKERVRYMLADSNAKVLIAERSDEGNEGCPIPVVDFLVLDLGARQKFIQRGNDAGNRQACSESPATRSPQPVTNPSNLVYIIYTSGSTGRPKGVMIENTSLVNRLNWMQKRYRLDQTDTILQKTPYTFDVSLWEMFWWVLAGAKLCFLIPGGEKDPKILVDTIARNKITMIHFVPSMLNIFLEFVKNNRNGEIRNISGLRQVIASGEALTLSQVELFRDTLYSHHKTLLANLYGPTEATVDVSFFDVPFDEPLERVPIGKPIDNIELYILDAFLSLQPIGVTGECCISGVGLARGYLNKPELTGEKFVLFNYKYSRSNMYCMSYQPNKLYKTGDLTRWLPDGNIEYLGRIDSQVKIRGFRVELGEIETRLTGHHDIKEAVVLAKRDKSGDQCLCAYVVADQEILPSELKNYLATYLPYYMVPSYFTRIEKIPLNANGKLDSEALPAPDIKLDHGYMAPGNATEEELAAIWSEVLGIDKEKIGIQDNFFELGGNSFKIIRLSQKLESLLSIKIPVLTLFRYTTIHALSEYLNRENRDDIPGGTFLDEDKLEEMETSIQDTLKLFEEN